jgi:hypothetical protein
MMEDKINKFAFVGIASLLMVVFFIGLVSAQNSITGFAITDSFAELFGETTASITEISSKVLGDMAGTENISSESLLFARLLLLIILVTIFFTVLGRVDFFKGKGGLLWILSLSTGILAVRFFSAEIVETILVPYQTFGFVVTSLIPFVIFFLLVSIGMKNARPGVRRVAWIFFAVVFIGLWIYSPDLADNSSKNIYLATVVAAIIMLKLDGTIHMFFKRISVEKQLRVFDDMEYFRRKKENEDLEKAYLTLVTQGTEESSKKATKIRDKIKNNEEQMELHEAGIPDGKK